MTLRALSIRPARLLEQVHAAFGMLRVPVIVAACYGLLRTNADPDLWGHLRFGLDLLRSGHLSPVDPYSFTSDIAWTNHEWLAELIMGASYASLGIAGLILLKLLVVLTTFALLAMSLKGAPESWRWPTAFLVLLAVNPIAFTVRPQLWTMLFLVLECRILGGAPRQRFWLPLMFALWVNLHGGWIVGLGVLAVWSFFELFEPASRRPGLLLLLGVPVMSVLATLCNPYGWHMWEFLAGTVRLSRPDIIEWQPVWRESIGSVILWVAGVVWAGVAMTSAHRRPMNVMAVIAMLAFASLRVNRLLPLFIPVAAMLLLPYVREAGVLAGHRWPKGRTLVDLAFAALAVFWLAPPASAGCVEMRGTWLPDVTAAHALSAANPTGRMITWFDWGEYAIWHFGPRLKVSIDGRRETVYSERALQAQMDIAFGDKRAVATLEQSPPEYVWLPLARSSRTRDWLASHGYRIDVQTATSFVAVRRDLPRVMPVATFATGCFPDGPR